MRRNNWIKERRRRQISKRLRNIMKLLCSGKQLRLDEANHSSQSVATKDYSESLYSSRAGETDRKADIGNIAEAESSLRESCGLNYEEARALLGRYEYQKGNIEAALHVFEGIDISAITPKIKVTLASKRETRKRHSHNCATVPMSIHAVSLLLEAIFLKGKSLQALGRYEEGAQSCKVILDIVESSLPAGLPEKFGANCKLQETINNSVELLPELWKLADSPHEAILSYRRALLRRWNLDPDTTAKIQKEFSIFLLYSGGEASPPDLRSQMDSSFVPKNNIEEAILLLMVLLRKFSLKIIEWDPYVLDHLLYALSISGGLRALANQMKELLPGVIDQREWYHTLALCYYGEKDDLCALDLLRILLSSKEDSHNIPALLMASKICGESSNYRDGTSFARRAIENLQGKCDHMVGVANSLLGISLSARSRSAVTDSERVRRQYESLQSLETAGKMTKLSDPRIVYHLSLENAEQRKLDAALYYGKCLLKLEAGSNLSGWMLVARILSAQKQFVDAETIINAALDQTGKWDQEELLRIKAKLQIAQGKLKNATETYSLLLAVLQVQSKSFGSEKSLIEDGLNRNRQLELETWHDLALIYISLSKWCDTEICLSKSKAIRQYSASRWHVTGLQYDAKGLHKEALKAFWNALDVVDPTNVSNLVSIAMVLRQLDVQPLPVIRSFLTEALQLDRMNSCAWYNLGMLYKEKGGSAFAQEAAECFQAAALLKETEPVEPFR